MKNKKKAKLMLMLMLMLVVSFTLSGCGANRRAEKPSDNQALLDFTSIPDGLYRGMFTYGAFNFIVDVTAANGKVTAIKIIQNRGNQQSKNAEVVLTRIIEAQSLDVDAVSGATATSRALTKAVEGALMKALN